MSNRKVYRRLSIGLVLLLILTLISGCAKTGGNGSVDEGRKAAGNKEAQEESGQDAEKQEKEEKQDKEEKEEEKEPADEESDPSGIMKFQVSNVKELLDAVRPSAEIELAPGVYDLSGYYKETYDEGGEIGAWYTMEDIFDGEGECVISDVEDLTIRGSAGGKTELITEFAYADVLRFSNCSSVTLENLTLRHDVEPGECSGDVLELNSCRGVTLNNVDLNGSGACGLDAMYSSGIEMKNSIIHHCNANLMYLHYCSNVHFEDCSFRDTEGYNLLDLYFSKSEFTNCSFTGNSADNGLWLQESEYRDSMHSLMIFKGCSFGEFESGGFAKPYGMSGRIIFDDTCSFKGKAPAAAKKVSSVRELIEAIQPEATVLIAPGRYNMSEYLDSLETAERESFNKNHKYVEIRDVYDGNELIIRDCDHLALIGDSEDYRDTELMIDPRYATVLTVSNSKSFFMSGITMGHTKLGECSGNVLDLDGAAGVVLDRVDFYGCGAEGIFSYGESGDLAVFDSVIRDCEYNPMSITDDSGCTCFQDCTITGNGGGGFFGAGSGLVSFYRCTLGENESNMLAFAYEVETVDCTFADITGHPEYDYDYGDREDEYDYEDWENYREYMDYQE